MEVKNVPAVTASSPAAAEVPEKAGEVRESPVPMSEDPMAPKLAGNVQGGACVAHSKHRNASFGFSFQPCFNLKV